MIHQDAESLKELLNKYQFLLEKRESLTNEIHTTKDKYSLKSKKGELENLLIQIEKLKSLILSLLLQMQKLIDEIQTKDANRLY